MSTQEQIGQAAKLITEANEILVVMGVGGGLDHQATATALYLALKAAGKQVWLVSPELPNSDERIFGLDQISTESGRQNLLIAFDYQEDQVDKISYHIGEETKKFYLTIKPKKGSLPLDTKAVQLSYTGAECDLIITVGVSNLEHLSGIYLENEELFKNKPLLSLNEYETQFGTLKLSSVGFSSLSELSYQLLVQAQLGLDAQSSSNLLLGIEVQTKGLQGANAGAETFAAVAELLRAGAARKYGQSSQPAALPTNPVQQSQQMKQKPPAPQNTNAPKKPKETTVQIAKK